MRIIVTAGPTREFIDEVRFLSNSSSGRMGFAVAAAAADAGHQVTLVAGPVSLPPPRGVERVDVVSALDMHRVVMKRFAQCDAVVKTAAVCDYRPSVRRRGKIRKSKGELTLRLNLNPDILAELGRRKSRQLLVGFALEPTFDHHSARRKLSSKNLDAIVLNATPALGAERTSVEILTKGGAPLSLQDAAKEDIARRLVTLLEEVKAEAPTEEQSPAETED